MSKNIYLPRSAKLHDEPKPLVCLLCKARFAKSEERQWVRHVRQCSKDHEQETNERRMANKLPGFYDDEKSGIDIELERWVREHSQAILEGRKRY